MTAVYLGAWVGGSPEWHKAREGRIGGSDIAAIAGLSQYESPFSLWHRRKGLIGEQVEEPWMTWGKRLEFAIVMAFGEAHPQFDVECRPGVVYHHTDRPWQVCSPDALLSIDGENLAGLEVKCDRFADEWGTPGTDEIPPAYLAQVRWCLDVFGLDVWHVAVLVAGADYSEYVVHRDDKHQADLRDQARAFLDSLENDQRPGIDTHGQTYEAVRVMHPQIEAEDVELTHEQARDYCAARTALAAAKGEETRAKSVVADALGNARRARYLGQTVAQRQAKPEGTPYLVAARNLPTFDIEAAS